MNLVLYSIGGIIGFLLLVLILMSQVHYRIGSRHLKVILFGLPLRRVELANIRNATKREPRKIAERWHNTFKTSHRLLTVEKEGGLFRFLCITPRNRYVFLGDLKKAVRRVNPGAEWVREIEPEHPTTPLHRSPDEPQDTGS